MSIRLFILVFFVSVVNVFSQFSPEYDKYKAKFPEAYIVRLNEETNIDIKLVSGEVIINEHVYYENMLLSKSATFVTKNQVGYSSFSEISDLEASSINFIDGKYTERNVENFVESDNLGQNFYDDLRKIEFLYPALNEGSKTKLSYSRSIKNPRFLSSHYFASSFPIVNNKLKITVDNSIELDLKNFNLNAIDIDYSMSKGRNKTIYEWKSKNIEAFDVEKDAPNYDKLFPHVIPIIKNYNYKGQSHNVSGSVASLYSWYYSLVENVNSDAKGSEELKNIVSQLTSDKETELEKVKAIYYWVQENIKYIAFEYALGGFIPREAVDIFNKKYGDCKDNSSILLEMLKIAGIEGNLTWIGTRDIPYTYEELPTPAVDNHMILSYKDNDNTYYLDATGRFVPIDMPTTFIQGKEALIGINKENYRIQKVPIVEPERNIIRDSICLKISDRRLDGIGKLSLNGYPKIDFFNVLEKIPTKEKLREYYNYQLRKGNNRFLIEELKENNKFDYEKNFEIEYIFNIENYIKSYQDEFYVNMNIFHDFSSFKVDKKREYGKKYEYRNLNILKASLEVPENLEITFIPKDYSFSDELFECSIQYKKREGNFIDYILTVKQNFIDLDKTEQLNLNKTVREIEKHYKDVVVLSVKK